VANDFRIYYHAATQRRNVGEIAHFWNIVASLRRGVNASIAVITN
jgi:hypothetical protein